MLDEESQKISAVEEMRSDKQASTYDHSWPSQAAIL